MARPGAKIDENIGCGQRCQTDQTEDVARRGGLIKDHLLLPLDRSGARLFELKDSTDQLVEVVVIVIAHAFDWPGHIFNLRRGTGPPKQTVRPVSTLNFIANGLVEFKIHSLQSGRMPGPGDEFPSFGSASDAR